MVAPITFFGANSGRNSGCGAGDKDANKPDAIVSLHIADNSKNGSDDNGKPVESFKSDDSKDGRTKTIGYSLILLSSHDIFVNCEVQLD